MRLFRSAQHSIIVVLSQRRSAPSLALKLDKGPRP
jgi:hypothetical protein